MFVVLLFISLSLSQSLPPSYKNITQLTIDFQNAKKDILGLLVGHSSHATSMFRLAWHDAGTFCKYCSIQGGAHANMRFPRVAADPADAGLDVPRGRLAKVYVNYAQNITLADFWQFAADVCIEFMTGPHIPFRPGRIDLDQNQNTPPDRLPDAALGFPDKNVTAYYLKDIFYRMGFNDQEIVALSGGHTIGECHKQYSGFYGPWTNTPTVFDNAYFIELVNWNWVVTNGTMQYEDTNNPGDGLMMLQSDVALMSIPEFKKWVLLYASDKARFFKDFTAAFEKLQENGSPNLLPPINW